MRDHEKTKAELIEELSILRARLRDQSLAGLARPPRVAFDTRIEFESDFDLVEAKGVNLSREGVCFELPQAMPFKLRFGFEDNLHSRRAELVWVRKTETGRYRFGFRFAAE